MRHPSDAQLRARVRNVLTRHWVDLRALDVGCFRGVVRLRGELRHTGRLAATPADRAKAELVAGELRGLRGVRRLEVDFENRRELDRNARRPDLAPLPEPEAPPELDLSGPAVGEAA